MSRFDDPDFTVCVLCKIVVIETAWRRAAWDGVLAAVTSRSTNGEER